MDEIQGTKLTDLFQWMMLGAPRWSKEIRACTFNEWDQLSRLFCTAPGSMLSHPWCMWCYVDFFLLVESEVCIRSRSHQISPNGEMMPCVKSLSTYQWLNASINDPEEWVLTVRTCFPSSGIKIFVNGCIVTATTYNVSRTHNVTRNFTL